MTDLIPYAAVRDGAPLVKALAQEKLPAQCEQLDADHVIKVLLRKTWSLLPAETRPSMQWCLDFLKYAFFFAGTDTPIPSGLPELHETLNPAWKLTHNPATPSRMAFEIIIDQELPCTAASS